jgi:hypothetical protein
MTVTMEKPKNFDKASLQRLVEQHQMTIDGCREGAGKFRDLEIGIGKTYKELAALKTAIFNEASYLQVQITHVSNEGHKHFGKCFIVIHSFWYE